MSAGQPTKYVDEAAHASLSPVLTAELSRLYAAGFWLMPLGGEDGRTPALRFKKDDGAPVGRHPLASVVNKLITIPSRNYAIRLNGLLVVDIDTDTSDARDYVERRFGASTVQVKTRRGVHHWFRFEGKPPAKVRLPGIAIDFKAGVQQLAAGPFAERKDGAQYLPLKGRLESISALPEFIDREPPVELEQEISFTPAGKVAVSSRNTALWRASIEYAPCVDSLAALAADLRAHRDWHFDNPESVSDDEVRRVAEWAWQKRCDNQIWSGRSSEVRFPRSTMDRLLRHKHGSDAFLVYCLLRSEHGHIPGRVFPIVPAAMREAGLIEMSRNRLYRAIHVLVGEGFLKDLGQDGLNRAKRYQLVGRDVSERGGESVSYYLDTQFRDMGETNVLGIAP